MRNTQLWLGLIIYSLFVLYLWVARFVTLTGIANAPLAITGAGQDGILIVLSIVVVIGAAAIFRRPRHIPSGA